MDIGLGGLGEEEVGAWLEGGGVRVGRARREERLLNVGSLWVDTVWGAEMELVVRRLGGLEKVRDTVGRFSDGAVEGVPVVMDGISEVERGGEESSISKVELSNEEVSDTFLFILVTMRGLAGVPLQGCCLWQVVWNVDLQAKHLTGFAFFLMGLLQKGQIRSEMLLLPELWKFVWRTALLKAEISWPRALPGLRKRPRRRFLTNQTAATVSSGRIAPPCT